MGHNGCLMFCQITADEEQRVVFPQFRPLLAHSILQLPDTTVCGQMVYKQLYQEVLARLKDAVCSVAAAHSLRQLPRYLQSSVFN
jgi:hypothetical protein